jgi:hypothetical protein
MAVEGGQAKRPQDVKPAQGANPASSGGKGPAPDAGSRGRAPAWLVPAYLGGLVLLYIGERVIVTEDKLRVAFSIIGVALVIVATALRFAPQYRGRGDRASIQRVLGYLSLVGVAGVAVYFATTSWGQGLLGIADLEAKTRENVGSVLLITWVTLIAASIIPMSFAEAALHPMRNSPHIEARRVKAAAASGLALSLAAAYCSLFVYAASQTKAQADYSYFKTSEPGSSTRKMVESFTEPLKITAFFPDVSDVRGEVSTYLTELTKGMPNVELSVVDRYLEPKLAKDLKVFSDGTIVFAKGDTTRTLTVGSEMSAARAKLKTLDRDVQEQLYKLLRSRRLAYLTVGHGEMNGATEADKAKGRSAEILQEILRSQNYQIRTLGLAQGLGREVPGDAEIVFVLGPTEPFAPEELASLQRFADGGGHLFMALDADSVTNEVPVAAGQTEQAAVQQGQAVPGAAPEAVKPSVAESGLSELAKIAGLSYSPVLLANDTNHVRRRANNSDRTLLVSNRFSSHASVSTLSRNASRAAIIFARTGSLAPLGTTGAKVDMALRAMAGTFADVNQNYDFDKDEKKDTYNLVAAVSKPLGSTEASEPKPDAPKEGEAPVKEMRAFVLADADSMSDLLMGNFGPNRLLLMDAIRWLGGEDSFAGEVNDEEDVRIEHTKQKDLVWFYSTIIGMPLLVLGVGLTFSRRARRTGKVVSS